MHTLVLQSLVSFLFLFPVVSYGQISDDFNDDFDEQSWQDLNPLKDFVDWAYFINDSTYRMISGASPDPDALGQARIGAMRKDANYSAFRVGVDLAPFDPAIEQDVGVLARITTAGLGTTSGYAATIDTDESRIYIARIDLEQPTILGEADSPLDPEKMASVDLQES